MIELDPVALLEQLISVNSVNPSLGGPGESELALLVAGLLRDAGSHVDLHEVEPGRPNVLATLAGGDLRPSLLFEVHLDTVPWPREPMVMGRSGARINGRGACDAKGSLAAMLAAFFRVGQRDVRPPVAFAAVVDEEVYMAGSLALLPHLPPLAGAIVGEPTSLLPVRAHNGLVRFRVVARGRAAHTSRAYLGRNAVAAGARVVLAIEDELRPRCAARAHPLTGPALVTASVIRGGTAVNLVPDWCEVEVDRRLAPGEEPATALEEIDELLDGLRRSGDDLLRESPVAVQRALETPADHPLVRAAERAATADSRSAVSAIGVPFGTDASNLSGVGRIPCVVLGPGSIDQAHSADEWVEAEDIRSAVGLYERLVDEFMAATDEGRDDGAVR